MKSGMIKLFRGGRSAKLLRKVVYCSVDDRDTIIEEWRKDYDAIFMNCFIQIRPSIYRTMKPDKLKQLQEASKKRYNSNLIGKQYQENVVKELSLPEKVEKAIENEIKKEVPKAKYKKNYAKPRDIVRSRGFVVDDVKVPIVRPPAVYDNNKSLYDK